MNQIVANCVPTMLVFFDPGFGWHGGKVMKNQGTRAVMEVRPHDVPFMVEDGQTFLST